MRSLFKRVFELKESRCTIIADREEAIEKAVDSIRRNREALEDYVRANPRFLYSLEPVKVPAEPLVAKLMAEAAEKADVGPMAAVAGVLADLAVKDLGGGGCGGEGVGGGGGGF